MGGGGIMLVVRFGGGANEAGSLSCEIGVALWPLAARSPSSRRKTPVWRKMIGMGVRYWL